MALSIGNEIAHLAFGQSAAVAVEAAFGATRFEVMIAPSEQQPSDVALLRRCLGFHSLIIA